MKLLRELFRFSRYSPLDRQTCVERLTMDYQKEMIKKGLYPEVVSGFKWGIYVRWHKKTEERSGVLICSHSNWGVSGSNFYYRVFPKSSNGGTVLHCTHNPFTPFAMLFLALASAFLFVASLVSAIDGQNILRMIIMFPFYAIPISIGFTLEYFARRAFLKYLHDFLDVEECGASL